MCHSADNSLPANLAAQGEMLRNGIVTFDRMPTLRGQAEDAERAHRILMEQSGWTPEQLLKITGYRVLVDRS